MIEIIKGKRYNTDTAKMVASHGNGLGSGNFFHLYEELYITAKGAWFLYGEGGSMSKYGKSEGNQSWGSTEIIPFTPKEAYEWCEQHSKVEVIEEHFSANVEEA